MIEARDFCIRADLQLVEAWAAWPLPYGNLTPTQCEYRASLRKAINGLAKANKLTASYRSTKNIRKLDVENILFYNVGAAYFRNIAARILCFHRGNELPPAAPRPLNLIPGHYVRYKTEVSGSSTEFVGQLELAQCPPVSLRNIGELSELPKLWWLFKDAIEKAPGASRSAGEPFGVELRVAGPEKFQPNLVKLVKPLMDGFISALHHYEGNQLDDVACRAAALLNRSSEEVRSRLVDDRISLLGPYRVPHLRGTSLQWSPADHLLASGALIYEISGDQSIAVSGRIFRSI